MRRQIAAIRFVRAMRGGAQAHLVEANDGHYYVVKFLNNPQHRRVLINEWIGAAIMRRLGLSVPETNAVQISGKLLAENPAVCFQLARKTLPVAPGLALGSRYPGNPDRLAVYDFVPSSLLRRVSNYGQFFGAFVFDKWVGNTDKRQAIFHRQHPIPGHRACAAAFVATFIDNGFAFGGAEWDLRSVGPLAGLYYDRAIYADITSWDLIAPWIASIRKVHERELWRIISEVPEEWIADEGDRLRDLAEALLQRRARLSALIEDVRRAEPTLFPNWTKTSFSASNANYHPIPFGHCDRFGDRVQREATTQSRFGQMAVASETV